MTNGEISIKELPNGMVVFDNGVEYLQIRYGCISSIRIWEPSSTHSEWRVQINTDNNGCITFEVGSREEADDIVRRINEVIPSNDFLIAD